MSNGGHNRSPLLRGLLLILLGGIFLLYRFDRDLGIGHLLARYWPVLIILWGVSRLAEHLMPRQEGAGRPAFLSGGEAALLVAVIVVLCGMAAVDIIHRRIPDLDLNLNFNGPYTQTQNLAPQTLPADAHVAIRTDRGNIILHAGGGSQLVVAATTSTNGYYFFPALSDHGRRTLPGNENSAQDQVGKADVVIEQTGDGYIVHPTQQYGPGGRLTVNLDVEVPKNIVLSATSNRGDISVTGVDGPVHVEAHDGDVEIHNAGAGVTLTMQKGDAHIVGVTGDVSVGGKGSEIEIGDVTGDATINGDFYGPIRAHNIRETLQCAAQESQVTLEHLVGKMMLDSGQIEISGTTGPAKISTRHKDLSVEDVGGRLDVADTHGDVQVRYSKPPREEVNIQNETGEVEVNLPANSNFEIAAASAKGEAQSDFAAPSLNVASGDEAGAINGRVGTGGPKISIATTYGTIHLRKATSIGAADPGV